MQAIPSRDTAPEKALCSILQAMGLRFRKDIEPIDGIRCKADVVFRTAKVCVFIDGCFWHGCPTHFRPPKTNVEWWLEKLQDNKNRDEKKALTIKKHRWIVLRYWEHEIRQDNIFKIGKKIYQVVMKRVPKGRHEASPTPNSRMV